MKKYPEAKFTSTSFKEANKSSATLKGNLTLHGVTNPISMIIKQIGAGKDPWGGYRRGFEGSLKIALADYGIDLWVRLPVTHRRVEYLP